MWWLLHAAIALVLSMMAGMDGGGVSVESPGGGDGKKSRKTRIWAVSIPCDDEPVFSVPDASPVDTSVWVNAANELAGVVTFWLLGGEGKVRLAVLQFSTDVAVAVSIVPLDLR